MKPVSYTHLDVYKRQSILYAYTGIIEVNTIFSGYNSTTIVLLAGMMVVGSSLFLSLIHI